MIFSILAISLTNNKPLHPYYDKLHHTKNYHYNSNIWLIREASSCYKQSGSFITYTGIKCKRSLSCNTRPAQDISKSTVDHNANQTSDNSQRPHKSYQLRLVTRTKATTTGMWILPWSYTPGLTTHTCVPLLVLQFRIFESEVLNA